MNTVLLSNKIQITKLNGTQSGFFKEAQIGDIINFEVDLNSKLKSVTLKNFRTSKEKTCLIWDVMRTLQVIEYITIN